MPEGERAVDAPDGALSQGPGWTWALDVTWMFWRQTRRRRRSEAMVRFEKAGSSWRLGRLGEIGKKWRGSNAAPGGLVRVGECPMGAFP